MAMDGPHKDLKYKHVSSLPQSSFRALCFRRTTEGARADILSSGRGEQGESLAATALATAAVYGVQFNPGGVNLREALRAGRKVEYMEK